MTRVATLIPITPAWLMQSYRQRFAYQTIRTIFLDSILVCGAYIFYCKAI